MPPANTFVKLCNEAKIAVPATAARHSFLSDAGILASTIPASKFPEKCAALSWARDSIGKQVDPVTWSTSLSDSMQQTLLSLYALPPYKGAAPAPHDLRRLAEVIALYSPADDGAGQAPPPPLPQPDGIDTSCPDGAGGSGGPAPQPGAPPAPPPPSGALGGTGPPTLPLKRKPLLHRDLSQLLHQDVYNALDPSSGMEPQARSKLAKACSETDLSMVLDYTTSAPFNHLTSLSLSEGMYFDPAKRGLALAGVGRSAVGTPLASTAFNDALMRDTHLYKLRQHWTDLLPVFAGAAELSSSDVDHLWSAVQFILTLRASRSTTWGVPEVASSCQAQLDAIPAYRAAVAVAVSRSAASFDRSTAARLVNRSYITFFTAFWWEHILERPRLKADDLEKTVRDLMTPAAVLPLALALPAPAPPPPPTPGPTPPAHAQPPWPYPHPPPTFYPTAGPPGYPNFQYPPPAPAPFPNMGGATLPPPPPYAPPHPAPPATARPGAYTPPFCGKPLAQLVCGNNFGMASPPPGRPCPCTISVAFPGRHHRTFECPFKYWQLRGSCPGWTAAGTRIPTSWNGDDITTACQAEWRLFAAALPPAKGLTGREVTF